jgi:hypothetical protein
MRRDYLKQNDFNILFNRLRKMDSSIKDKMPFAHALCFLYWHETQEDRTVEVMLKSESDICVYFREEDYFWKSF